MSYISLANFQSYSGGIDITNIADDELQAVLDSAASLIDAETNNSWAYQTIYEEQHDWDTGRETNWQGYPYYRPLRTLTQFDLASSINPTNGDFYKVPIPVTPTGPPTLRPGQLPTNYGQVNVDRDRGILMTTYTLLQWGLPQVFFPIGPFKPVQLLISYTSGYDDGTIQSDGYSLPAPAWLSEINRMAAMSLLVQRATGAAGMLGFKEVRQGQTTYTFDPSTSSFGLSPEMKNLLRHKQQTVMH